MLGKLTKYEIKATARIFLPLYAGLLLFALINKVFIEINLLQTKMAFLSAISGMIYFFIIVATFIITLVVMIQRFYKNLLSDEGYLMFTIPVTPSKHIISKMIVSILWAVVSVIAAVLSVLVLGYRKGIFGDIGTSFGKKQPYPVDRRLISARNLSRSGCFCSSNLCLSGAGSSCGQTPRFALLCRVSGNQHDLANTDEHRHDHIGFHSSAGELGRRITVGSSSTALYGRNLDHFSDTIDSPLYYYQRDLIQKIKPGVTLFNN